MIPRERSSQLENYGPRTALGGLILISAWEKRFYSLSLANTALYRRCVLHEQFFQSGILETNSFQHGVARGRPINLKNVSLAGDAGAIAAIRANIASQGRRRLGLPARKCTYDKRFRFHRIFGPAFLDFGSSRDPR
jgi:hypothetical protein